MTLTVTTNHKECQTDVTSNLIEDTENEESDDDSENDDSPLSLNHFDGRLKLRYGKTTRRTMTQKNLYVLAANVKCDSSDEELI